MSEAIFAIALDCLVMAIVIVSPVPSSPALLALFGINDITYALAVYFIGSACSCFLLYMIGYMLRLRIFGDKIRSFLAMLLRKFERPAIDMAKKRVAELSNAS